MHFYLGSTPAPQAPQAPQTARLDFSVNLVYMRILIFLLHGPAERRPTSVITDQTTDISEITRGYVKQGL